MQWISANKTNCAIHWIAIYPVDSVIYLLNNWGLSAPGPVLYQNQFAIVQKQRTSERPSG